MNRNELTDDQRNRIQRWFDGELDGPEGSDVEELVESNEAAREYLERLREIRSAMSTAHEEVASAAKRSLDAEALVRGAVEAPPADEEPLEELAPLLERYHDGETLEVESREVERLRRKRPEVDKYLAVLREIGDSVRAADERARTGVDFESIRVEVERRLDEPEPTPELLHRYADGEADDAEAARAEEWVDQDAEAREAVEAIDELGDAARAADEAIRSQTDFDGFWEGVERRIDEGERPADGESGTVVSLGTDAERVEDADDADSGSSVGGTVVELFSDYRSHLAGAAAAAVVLIAAAALLRPGLFQNGERVVVKEKKTVVIVDSVEYSSGSSVVVDSPMKKVRSPSGKSGSADTEKDESSTVIWLLDSGKSDSDGSEGATPESSEESATPKGDDDEHADPEPSRDAGDSDTSRPPSGQPI